MTRRVLVVCTANVCRSPCAERLLARRLDGLIDVDGESWTVRSAGISDVRGEVDPNTVAAARSVGLDLSTHMPRTLNREILSTDGADLVIVMTREQLRAVSALAPDAWPRTFTLKELARRSMTVGPVATGESFASWRGRLADGRRAAELMGVDAADDVPDPYSLSRRHHVEMITELVRLTDQVVRAGPWQRAVSPEPIRSGP